MRVLELAGDPGSLGEAHGRSAGGMIRAYLADRLALSGDSLWSGQTADADTILQLAGSTVELFESAYIFNDFYAAPDYDRGGVVTTTASSTGRWSINRILDSGFRFFVRAGDGTLLAMSSPGGFASAKDATKAIDELKEAITKAKVTTKKSDRKDK